METFHEKLKEYRERAGMMQSVLAERSGLTKSHLNRVEKGLRPPPQAETVLRMVEVLRLSPSEAKEVVELAGYSPRVLEVGEPLSYNSPTIPDQFRNRIYADLSRLHEAIAKIPAQSQQIYVDALTQLIENLANTNNTQPNKTKLEDRSE